MRSFRTYTTCGRKSIDNEKILIDCETIFEFASSQLIDITGFPHEHRRLELRCARKAAQFSISDILLRQSVKSNFEAVFLWGN